MRFIWANVHGHWAAADDHSTRNDRHRRLQCTGLFCLVWAAAVTRQRRLHVSIDHSKHKTFAQQSTVQFRRWMFAEGMRCRTRQSCQSSGSGHERHPTGLRSATVVSSCDAGYYQGEPCCRTHELPVIWKRSPTLHSTGLRSSTAVSDHDASACRSDASSRPDDLPTVLKCAHGFQPTRRRKCVAASHLDQTTSTKRKILAARTVLQRHFSTEHVPDRTAAITRRRRKINHSESAGHRRSRASLGSRAIAAMLGTITAIASPSS